MTVLEFHLFFLFILMWLVEKLSYFYDSHLWPALFLDRAGLDQEGKEAILFLLILLLAISY